MKLAFLLPVILASCATQSEIQWTSITIDGQRRSDFKVITRGGKVIGGHDGCNAWSHSNRDGIITIDLEGCSHDPVQDAYWVLVNGEDTKLVQRGSRLDIVSGSHKATFAADP